MFISSNILTNVLRPKAVYYTLLASSFIWFLKKKLEL